MSSQHVVVIGSAWFCTSALMSTYANTAFLEQFDAPYLLTTLRFTGSTAIGVAANTFDTSKSHLTWAKLKSHWKLFGPSALLLLGANLTNSVSLQLTGITLTYVVKSSIPVVTVLYGLWQGATYPVAVYFAILLTVLGIMLAAWSDMEFSYVGFIAAFTSMLLQSFLNIRSKQAIRASKLSGGKSFFVMASLCTLILVPACIGGALVAPQGLPLSGALVSSSEFGIMLMAMVAYHVEYQMNFVFTALVEPLTFSISDIARRLAIVGAGALLFNKSLSLLNILGVGMCFTGILWYSVASRSQEFGRARMKSNVEDITGLP